MMVVTVLGHKATLDIYHTIISWFENNVADSNKLYGLVYYYGNSLVLLMNKIPDSGFDAVPFGFEPVLLFFCW